MPGSTNTAGLCGCGPAGAARVPLVSRPAQLSGPMVWKPLGVSVYNAARIAVTVLSLAK
jgi:hypothetical protein